MDARVTVILPAYNAMPFLPEAVESIRAQTLSAFRVLLVNDGSTDGTRQYLDSIQDPRFQVIHKENEGLGATLQLALGMVETEYVARMDADDVAMPERLARQVLYLDTHPNVVMLGTHFSFLVEGRIQNAPPALTSHEDIDSRLLRGRAGVCHPTIMCRARIAQSVGGYRIRGAGEDIDFCLRMTEVGEASNLVEVLHLYRLHLSSLGTSRREEIRLGYEYARSTAMARRRGRNEPSFQEVEANFKRRGNGRKLMDALDGWSGLQYRRGRILLAKGDRAAGYSCLIAAAVLRPGAALRVMWQYASRIAGHHDPLRTSRR